MKRVHVRALWLLGSLACLAIAVWCWLAVAREGLRYGPGLQAVSSSVGAVFCFLGWSQVPRKDR